MIRSMGLLSLVFVLTSVGEFCRAGVMFDINYEQDGVYASGTSFGTIEVSETGPNELTFSIVLNRILGPDPDIHQFGFTTNYNGPLELSSVNPDPASSGFFVSGPITDGKVQAILTGPKSINYVIDFGNGGFKLSTVEFVLTGTDMTDTFKLYDLTGSSPVYTNGNKTEVNFALHVQNTSTPALATSEALAGTWTAPLPVLGSTLTTSLGGEILLAPGTGVVPEPTTLAIWSALGVCGLAVRRKRSKK